MSVAYKIRNACEFPSWSFETVEVEYDRDTASVWMHYAEAAPPYYSLQTLADMVSVRESVRAMFESGEVENHPIRYFVMGSRRPGIFKLGGDLAMFADSIRDRRRETLTEYAHACIDVVHGLYTAFDLPIVTLAVIDGKALGGGLEAALACDYVLATEDANIGVPEVAFNTFPGMGAISLLSRRLGNAGAEDMISSGRTYDGREAYDLGVIDLIAKPGEGRAAALAWMTERGQDLDRRRKITAMRRRLFPVYYEDLKRITDLWVECSCGVTPQDIRHMERLASAQKRRFT
jgi:DSF synthase